MKKAVFRIFALVLVGTLLVIPTTNVSAVALAENISSAPLLYAGMESDSEAANVLSQLSGEGGTAALCSDRKEGLASLKVTSGTAGAKAYSEYAVIPTGEFETTGYSSIDLWIKPGLGADWIEFYAGGSLIKSDDNKDGRFEVAKEMETGVWEQIRLNFWETDPTPATIQDLVVRTNWGATWLYDAIAGTGVIAKTVNLTAMQNDVTEIHNNRLEFKKDSNHKFSAGETVMVSSSNVLFEKEFDTETDFSESIPAAGSIIASGTYLNFTLTDVCTGGTAICGENSDLADAQRVFNSSSGSWYSGDDPSYIGYQFSEATTIYGATIKQMADSLSKDRVQYYNDSLASWVDICTVSFAVTETTKTVVFEEPITATQFRVTGAKEDLGEEYWTVYNLEFLAWAEQYISPVIDISSAELVSSGNIWVTTLNNASVTIETSVSTNGGASWGAWQEVESNGKIAGITPNVSFGNGRLKFRLSIQDGQMQDTVSVDKVNIQLETVGDHTASSVHGVLEGLNISADMRKSDGTIVKAESTEVSLPSATAAALSGDGMTMYFANNADEDKLYKLDLSTGMAVKLSDTYINHGQIYVSYDGKKACFYVTETVSNAEQYNLYLYDEDRPDPFTNLCVNTSEGRFANYYMNEQGYVVYIRKTTSNGDFRIFVYDSVRVKSEEVGTLDVSGYDLENAPIRINENGKELCIPGGIMYTKIDGIWVKSETEISYTAVSNDLKKLYYKKDDISYEYDVTNKLSKRLDIDADKIEKVFDNGQLVLWDNVGVTLYDSATNVKTTLLSEKNLYTEITFFDISSDGSSVLYQSGRSGMKVRKQDEEVSNLKVLLSFDNKKSWQRYCNGIWEKVYTGAVPPADLLKEKGMTQSEVNALQKDCFSSLYANGADVYSVDVAVWFSSMDPDITPSIGGIYILAAQNSKWGNHAHLYASDKIDFPGANWREVNRVYPIEINRLSAEFTYFIYSDNQYRTYDGTWHTESDGEISELLGDMKANWTSLQLKGMSAQQVRAIPSEALTEQLAYKNFSVVYCVRIKDSSDDGYYSKVSVDYTADLFAGTSLSINLVMVDGTEKTFSGLTDSVIEDFMSWYTSYRAGRESNVYRIKQGNENFFVNHDLIQSIRVTEAN